MRELKDDRHKAVSYVILNCTKYTKDKGYLIVIRWYLQLILGVGGMENKHFLCINDRKLIVKALGLSVI